MTTPTNINEESITSCLSTLSLLEPRIREVAIVVGRIRGDSKSDRNYDHFFYFDWLSEEVIAKFSEYYSGETDNWEEKFPISYLWEENFEEIETTRYKAEREEVQKRAETIRRLEEERSNSAKEALELSLYKTLKAKYEK
jgi:hypothetical protein